MNIEQRQQDRLGARLDSMVREANAEIKEIAQGVPHGQRNDSATRLVGWLLGPGGLEEAAVLELMECWNERNDPPLNYRELERVVASIARAEAQNPSRCQRRAPRGGVANYEHTDDGVARRLVDELGDDILYCPEWDRWLIWNGSYWDEDEGNQMRELVIGVSELLLEEAEALRAQAEDAAHEQERDALRKQAEKLAKLATSCQNSAKVKNILWAAQAKVPVSPHQLDKKPFLLNCTNGTVDLRTGKLRDADPADLLTKCTRIAYDPEAQCPRWRQFLQEIMDRDKDLTDFLQRAVGYSITGDVSEHRLFLIHGDGANGKSTFINTILRMLGEDYAKQAMPGLLTLKYHGRHPVEIADLCGARFVCSTESAQGKRLDEELTKKLTGGDRLRARRLYENPWGFDPSHKLWLAGNHKPHIRGQDHAIWRRIVLIPFAVRIPEGKQDKHLEQKLAEELPGILNWAVAGCVEWQTNGLCLPETVRTATGSYRAEEDELGAFIEECCTLGESAWDSTANLYAAYTDWCRQDGQSPVSKIEFGRELARKGFDEHRTSEARGWHGISVAEVGSDSPLREAV